MTDLVKKKKSGNECRLCGSTDTKIFFDMPSTYFWYGEDNKYTKANMNPKKLESALYFCKDCGFIGLEISEQLRSLVEAFYQSPFSKPGTTHGQNSNYSKRLTEEFFNCFKRLSKEWFPKSVLEVGCQSGYLLHEFKLRGANRVVGIEPGNIDPYVDQAGIPVDIKRGFLSRDVISEGDYDLIFALQVLEHIEDLTEFLEILRDLLGENGRLLIAVPNERYSLEDGNIGMLMHQHFNYFTQGSLSFILSKMGFNIISLISENDKMLYVMAEKSRNDAEKTEVTVTSNTFESIDNYSIIVNEKLKLIERIVKDSCSTVGLYGINCSLPNIFSWIPELSSFPVKVFDSDSLKWGKYFSGVPFSVQSPERLDQISDVIAIPYRLQKEIVRFLRKKCKSTTEVHSLY